MIALEFNIFQKNIAKIYRIRVYDSIMCGCLCIGFIDFMLKSQKLLDCTNLLSPNKYKKNDEIIIFSFIKKVRKKKLYCVTCGK